MDVREKLVEMVKRAIIDWEQQYKLKTTRCVDPEFLMKYHS